MCVRTSCELRMILGSCTVFSPPVQELRRVENRISLCKLRIKESTSAEERTEFEKQLGMNRAMERLARLAVRDGRDIFAVPATAPPRRR